MKRTSEDYRRLFSPVLLYREDYDEIIDHLKGYGHDCDIVADEFKLDKPEQIDKLNRQKICHLEIWLKSPRKLHITLTGGYSHISGDEDLSDLVVVRHRIETVLMRCRKFPALLWRPFGLALPTFLSKKLAVLDVRYRRQTPSFVARNFEKILVDVIKYGVIAVASFLLGRFTKHDAPPQTTQPTQQATPASSPSSQP